jgi:hypothetical protein
MVVEQPDTEQTDRVPDAPGVKQQSSLEDSTTKDDVLTTTANGAENTENNGEEPTTVPTFAAY